MKQCSKCKEIKTISEFYRNKNYKDGYSYRCKKCTGNYAYTWRKQNPERTKETVKKWHENNPERILVINIKYRKNNAEKIKKANKEFYKNNIGYGKEYYKNNIEKYLKYNMTHSEQLKERRKQSKLKRKLNYRYRISDIISTHIWHCLKKNKNGYHWEDLVGYKLKDLITHIEQQFKEGMNWNNYGKYGWHIDHVIPVSLWHFNSYQDREFKQCWCLANLQPLWASKNMGKGNRI